ncbi:enoyl-CoA hydratase-related protein [Amycolatopsis pithecellobii]|uniref:Enoyl-CoA hydratase n=1 Tax=Amycolatopsis pithecellobii TaxID=664692 RepID=A0A6N7YTC2_9PSEU|nr:enoyl-CoA hydratase-related protein [Amycolatopsis pithecellobii]MTD55182.1 enoyl-CoA hydratase [Amycolatopsis pithecellobii]
MARREDHRVDVERRGDVLVIRMVRHAKRNAVDAAMAHALDAALNELDDDPGLRAGVLTGGPDMFCAGTDLTDGPGEPTPRGGPYGLIARRRSTPLIAAVEGVAYGGGFEIVMACDIVVAGRSARFALPEVSHGLVANCGALFRGQRVLPPMVARQLLLTGRPVTAERLYTLGLVSELVEDGRAEEAALLIAEAVAANSPAAVTATLHAVDDAAGVHDELGWDLTRRADAAIDARDEKAEGLAAFREKRQAAWSVRRPR